MAFCFVLTLSFVVSNILGKCSDFSTEDECTGQTSGPSTCRWAVVPGTGIYSGLRCTPCPEFTNGTNCSECDEGVYTSAGCPSHLGCETDFKSPYCTGTMTVAETFFTDGGCNGEDKTSCQEKSSDCGWSGLKDSKTECAERGYKCQCYNKTVHCTNNDTDADCTSCHSEKACLDTTGVGYHGQKTCRWSSFYGGVCTSCKDIQKGAECSNCDGDSVSCMLIDGCNTDILTETCTGTMNVNGAVAMSVPSLIMLFLLFLSLTVF